MSPGMGVLASGRPIAARYNDLNQEQVQPLLKVAYKSKKHC
jgi:hypothetical protein